MTVCISCIRREKRPGKAAFSFPGLKQRTESGVNTRIESALNKSLGNFWTWFVLQGQFHGRIRSGQRDIAGQVRQRLNIGVTDQRFPLFFFSGRYTITHRVSTVRVLLAGFEDFLLTNFTGSKLRNLFTRGAEEGPGVHYVKERGGRLDAIDVFQLGIGLNTKHITTTKFTRLREDFDQVRQLVQRGELVGENPHAPVTVLPHRQQAADSN